jgi:hypothetical protein
MRMPYGNAKRVEGPILGVASLTVWKEAHYYNSFVFYIIILFSIS